MQMASGAAATADTDYATIKTTLGADAELRRSPANCATLPNTPMQGACGFTALASAGRGQSRARAARAESRQRHRVVPLHDGGHARHAARARPHDLQSGRAGSGDRGEPGAGIPLNAHQRRAAALRQRAPRHGHRALLLLHPDAAGAGRHQHRLRRAAHGLARRESSARAAHGSGRREATSRVSIRFRSCAPARQIPLLVIVPNGDAGAAPASSPPRAGRS